MSAQVVCDCGFALMGESLAFDVLNGMGIECQCVAAVETILDF